MYIPMNRWWTRKKYFGGRVSRLDILDALIFLAVVVGLCLIDWDRAFGVR
jgi:type IV secretory pathway TrbD component